MLELYLNLYLFVYVVHRQLKHYNVVDRQFQPSILNPMWLVLRLETHVTFMPHSSGHQRTPRSVGLNERPVSCLILFNRRHG
jgi:hypothetical protein